MKRSILIISFDYPPVQSSSGLLRILAFSRDLADLGWEVTVLTSCGLANRMKLKENEGLLPNNVKVIRARAFDAARIFSIFGRYPGILEWPDRFSSWVVTATFAGLMQIRKYDTQVILSSYPIASAHLVGYILSKLTSKNWVADFRDPMLMAEHPETKLRRRAHAWVEAKALTYSRVCLFTNTKSLEHHIFKYPSLPHEKFHVVENGYDERLFNEVEQKLRNSTDLIHNKKTLKILHSGTLYPDHRDPIPLFQAICELKEEWNANGVDVKFIFRASGYDSEYEDFIRNKNIGDLVEFRPAIPYRESIEEILTSDALLLVQGKSCRLQVPAKLYEYLRAGKPLISLTDINGATAAVLDGANFSVSASNTSTGEIMNALRITVSSLWNDTSNTLKTMLATIDAESFSRKMKSKQLDEILCDL